MNVDELQVFNNINPISRYDLLIGNEKKIVKDISICILVALYAIDEIVKKETNITYFYYIKNDLSIFYLLNELETNGIDKKLFDEGIFILDFSKLIYRFTCAKKFKESDISISQLRLNSWGREYFKINNIFTDYEEQYMKIYSYYSDYFKIHKEKYLLLVSLLLGDLNKNTVEKIKQINDTLEIKLLS